MTGLHCPPDAPTETKRSLSEKTLDAAMEQIATKGYSDKYVGSGKTIYHAALAFLGRDDIEMRASVRDAALGAPAPCAPYAPLAVNEAAVAYKNAAATVATDKDSAATNKDAEIAEKDAEIARLRALLEQRG